MPAYIYRLTNITNNEFYIGQTRARKGPSYRFAQHKASINRRGHTRLQNAMRKYGVAAFVLDVVECVLDAKDLNDRERYWISTLHPQYNIRAGGETSPLHSSFSHKRGPMSEEQKEKLRKANLGKKASEETRAKMSRVRKGRPHAPEHRAKLAAHLTLHNRSERMRALRADMNRLT